MSILSLSVGSFAAAFTGLLLATLTHQSLFNLLSIPLVVALGYLQLWLATRGKIFGLSTALSLIYSLALVVAELGFVGIIFANHYGLNSLSYERAFYGLSASLIMLTGYLIAYRGWPSRLTTYRFLPVHLVALIPFVVLFAAWLIYPYFPGDDTYKYHLTVSESFRQGSIIQDFEDRRPAFTPLLTFFNHILGVGPTGLLGRLVPLLVVVSTLAPLFYYFHKSKQPNILGALLSVSVLAAPFLIFQTHYAYPQSLIIFLVPPVLLLLTESMTNRNWQIWLLAMVLSGFSVLFHELGFSLLLVSFLTGVLLYFRYLKRYKLQALRNTGIGLLILAPYIYILDPLSRLNRLSWIAELIREGLPNGVQWQWWYVDYYLNPDGIVFSYPGFMGVVWYAYLGLGVLLLLLMALVLWQRNWRALVNKLPALMFVLLFFFIAEVYPRISEVAFLPERAWSFLGISSAVVVAVYASERSFLPKQVKLLSILTATLIILGVGGYLVTVANRGILLSKHEHAAVEYIKNLPPEAVIVSPQSHSEGVAQYAGHRYLAIPPVDPSDVFSATEASLEVRDIRNVFVTVVVTEYNDAGEKISENITKKVLVDPAAQLQYIDSKTPPPMYFYFSKYRFENTKFVGSPTYLENNQQDMANEYLSYFKDRSVLSDENIVLFRLR